MSRKPTRRGTSERTHVQNNDPEEDTGPDIDDLQSVSGEWYHINRLDTETAGDWEVVDETRDNGPVAGKDIRRMFEDAAYNPEQPFWVGYDDAARNGFREVPIKFDALKRHLWVSGTTGAGKTTVFQNKAIQHIYGGYGLCNIDPKADGDTIDLLKMIPEHRLDDVVFLEPGSAEFDKIIGINLLDVPAIPSKVEREKEIENRLENLTAIFDNDEYWGPTMASITESMGRAMLRKNAQLSLDDDADPEDKYSVIDMYFILLSDERRQNFAEQVNDPYLSEFLGQIAQMDTDEVRPLLKRIKRWVENPVIRKIVAQRESTIDWDRIVDENKILLVRIPVGSQDVHQMISLTVLRNLWSAKKRQIRDDDREKRPYFVQVDEFEKVANDNLNMDSMLARARSFWLSITLGTQYPEQIKSNHEPILRAMENNCGTLLAMQTPGSVDARLLVKRFIDIKGEDLTNTNRFRCWTRIPLPDGQESEPLNLKTFAPYPPIWNESTAYDVIEWSLNEYGTTPITEQEIQDNLKAGNVAEIINPAATGGPDIHTDTNDNFTLDMVPEETFLECIFAAQIQHDGEEEPVPQSHVEDELEKRVGEVGFTSEISNKFEKDEYIVREGREDGEVTVTLTETGLNKVMSKDTGSSASGGGQHHRMVLLKSYKLFTKLGAITSLPTQEGDELPDGVADLPFDPMEKAESVSEANEYVAELQEDYPILYELSNGRDVAIEAETSTIKKPMQTLTNLRKAIESERTCVFTCKDATADDVDSHGITHWPRRGENVIYQSDGNGDLDFDTIDPVSKRFDTGDRHFYNMTNTLKVEAGRVVVVPDPGDAHNELVWREKEGKIVGVSQQGGGQEEDLISFMNPEALDDPDVETTRHREKVNGEWIVKTGAQETADIEARYNSLEELQEDYMELYEPFIPDVQFPRDPKESDFKFVVFPDDNNDEYDEPLHYQHGELTPVSEIEPSFTPPQAGMASNGSEASADTTGAPSDGPSGDPKGHTNGDTTAGTPSTNGNGTGSAHATNGATAASSQSNGTSDATAANGASPEASTGRSSVPASATVAPSELTGQFGEQFDIENLKTWATGTVTPAEDTYADLLVAIATTNPEAVAYIAGPEDISRVLGSVGEHDTPPDEDNPEAADTTADTEGDTEHDPDDATPDTQTEDESSDTSPYESTVPSYAAVNIEQVRDIYEDVFDIRDLKSWQSGAYPPEGDEYTLLLTAIMGLNPEAIAYIDRPEDVSAVLGTDEEEYTTREDSDLPAENDTEAGSTPTESPASTDKPPVPSDATVSTATVVQLDEVPIDDVDVPPYARGDLLPQGEAFQILVVAISIVNPDSIAYIDGPEDISRVLEIPGTGSAPTAAESDTDQSHTTTQHPPDQNTEPEEFF